MQADVKKAHRRRGFRLARDAYASLIDKRRAAVLIAVCAVTSSLGLWGVTAWVDEDPDSIGLLAPALLGVAAVTLGAAGICSWIWFRRDRPRLAPLTFLETGELGRVTLEDGSVAVPPERSETVLTAVAHSIPRFEARVVTSSYLAAISLLVLAAGALVLVQEPPNGLPAVVVGLQALNGFVGARASAVFLGQADAARHAALEVAAPQ